MDRRAVSLISMLFFAAGVAEAVTWTFNPATPMPGETIEITVLNQGCAPFLETEVRAAKPGANGLIRIGIVDVCDCIATPPLTPPLKAQIGPLPLGTYTTELLAVARNEGDPTCTGNTLVDTGQLVVSHSGQIAVLRTDPPQPLVGQNVSAVISTYCPRAFLPARIETEGTAHIIVIEEDPFAPLPPITCSTNPSFQSRINIGPLEAGTYRLRVTPPPVNVLPPYSVEAEHVFTVAPAGPGLLLQGNRFHVSATWNFSEHGPSTAQAVPLTRESGYFWFANADNVELVAKVLDGCAVNDHFWVFLAGLTNVEVKVTVEDTLTGETQSYTNALGTPFLPVQDTDAFDGCELGDPR